MKAAPGGHRSVRRLVLRGQSSSRVQKSPTASIASAPSCLGSWSGWSSSNCSTYARVPWLSLSAKLACSSRSQVFAAAATDPNDTVTASAPAVGPSSLCSRTYAMSYQSLGLFLPLAAAAANGRNKPKDWYDIAYVLLHNDDGPTAGADAVTVSFGSVAAAAKTWLLELHANFADSDSQGTRAYVEQFELDHPDQDPQQLGADAMLAVGDFCTRLLDGPRRTSLRTRRCPPGAAFIAYMRDGPTRWAGYG